MLASGKTLRGVYLREVHETARPSNHTIQVDPTFPKGAGMCNSITDNNDIVPVSQSTGAEQKLSLDLHLALVSNKSWVHTPQHLVLHHSGELYCSVALLYKQ